MATGATEVMGLIGEAYWMDLFLQIDPAFFKLSTAVQSEIWRRVIMLINSGMRNPGDLARAVNTMINKVEVTNV